MCVCLCVYSVLRDAIPDCTPWMPRHPLGSPCPFPCPPRPALPRSLEEIELAMAV